MRKERNLYQNIFLIILRFLCEMMCMCIYVCIVGICIKKFKRFSKRKGTGYII